MNLKRYFIFVEQTQCINLKKNEKQGKRQKQERGTGHV